MAYTLLQIAASYDRPLTTTHRHIKELQKKGKFVKSSPGKHFNEDEAHQLEELMKFKLRIQN